MTLLHPVEQVSWDDCALWLPRCGLELPTESQWEYAAQAGTATVWPTGNDRRTLEGAANLADRRLKRALAALQLWEEWLDDGHALHAPVGSLRPNSWGLHDVAGNVLEWCQDWKGAYPGKPRTGDGRREPAERSARALRGGGWISPAVDARVASRSAYAPAFRGSALGVRPCRVITD